MGWRFATVIAVSGGCLLAGSPDRSRPRHKTWPERRVEFKRRLAGLKADPALSPEQRFLHERVTELMAESARAPVGSYLLSRTCAAIDAFLDASVALREARSAGKSTDDAETDRRHSAHALERTYFRVKQGEYFSAQSNNRHGPDLVRLSRRLYQQARSAYDHGDFSKARYLADASREVIGGLERLAQAAVPIPTPPPLD